MAEDEQYENVSRKQEAIIDESKRVDTGHVI